MGKIIDLPYLDRPREKALRYGIEKLSDYELIALLISSGTKEESATDIAYTMISQNNGLINVINKPLNDLLSFKGIGKAKAIKIKAAFEIAKRCQSPSKYDKEKVDSSYAIIQRYRPLFIANSYQENLYLVILDWKKRIIHEMNLYRGNESSVSYSNRQIIQQVLMHNGHFFYVIHNHPSGSLEPSEGDVFFTASLINECRKFKIKMIDHLIISSKGYYSFLSQSKQYDH